MKYLIGLYAWILGPWLVAWFGEFMEPWTLGLAGTSRHRAVGMGVETCCSAFLDLALCFLTLWGGSKQLPQVLAITQSPTLPWLICSPFHTVMVRTLSCPSFFPYIASWHGICNKHQRLSLHQSIAFLPRGEDHAQHDEESVMRVVGKWLCLASCPMLSAWNTKTAHDSGM